MRTHLVLASAFVAATVTSVSAPVYAAGGIFYDPSNPASPTGKTIGYELFRTIGCPGRELLAKPCPVTAGGVAPVARAAEQEAPASQSALAPEATPSADRYAAGTAAGEGASGGTGTSAAPAALAAGGQDTSTGTSTGAAAPGTLVLEDVNFDFDKATLRPDAITKLDEAINSINSRGGSGNFEVAGHADSTGPAEYNLGLSRRRANAVRDYLVAKGIAADRLVVKGYGESRPVADNSTREGRAKNRRVELLPRP